MTEEVNLDDLRAKVQSIADKITELKKANPVDKDAIGASVKELLDAKRTFAQSNNGIGVDGKPWEEPMSKAEKKKKAKAEKAAAAAGGGNGDGAPKQVRDTLFGCSACWFAFCFVDTIISVYVYKK